ncbi:hypothetical protein KUTeg_006506 [Tegillarca granosa]|uniref:ubiquitinyl hydrolase 1 n=1 Tax=Tegillarca granosa TaxID=220873 RepID=A0ABQ9FGN9_TEGGR|nr:hypothetical protein KUTeg_006506 [Tegillarca granosa]
MGLRVMTVEQPALPQRFQSKRTLSREEQAKYKHLYNQIKEITGVEDENLIYNAIDACQDPQGKYNLENAVAMLVDNNESQQTGVKKEKAVDIPVQHVGDCTDARKGRADSGSQDKNNAEKPGVPESGTQVNKAQGVIDLTSETADTDDLQKAIVASLQDSQGILGGQVSREEQDISRVLEQSLIESKAGTKRKRGDVWFVDPLNPHERKRADGCPVGLKNVGNTCWFSAVIQSLFHLKRFRHFVLNFRPQREVTQGSVETRNLRFMQELRYLFALMIGSHKKYVDPSKAVEILKEAFSSSTQGVTDSQQDVSEFQHKLLEWLEDAFKVESTPPTSPTEGSAGDHRVPDCSKSKNPMVELFYGQYRAEGINEGKGFSNDETFGQFPLQVNGFRDIHESLEAATAQGEIETVSSDTTQKSGQELWFTRLPPVLTFELSRFQFNQQIGRPEKIHNKIEFPQVIYMDRYMICNKPETRQRRESVKKLREELSVLYAKLDRFNHYGSGSKKVPLQDVLSYALEFAHSKPESTCLTLSQDVEMESPRPHCSSMLTDSPVKSPSADVPMATSSTTVLSTPPRCTKTTAIISNPAPKHVTEGELRVLQDCLHRWRTEVEQDVRELQENINGLEDSVNSMYSDESMCQCPYYLHAVLVHEGQAASGHYWAYIYDKNKHWLKYNDITVSEASWEELVKESVGGYHNASAYCLMYIDKSRLIEKESDEEEHHIDSLPDDLKIAVLEDNKKFAHEIEEWDREQARKAAGSGGGGDADVTVVSESKPAPSTSTVATQTSQPQKLSLAQIHAQMTYTDTIRAVSFAVELEVFKTRGPELALKHAVHMELKTQEALVKTLPEKLPKEDCRLQHIVAYLKACEAPQHLQQRIMYEQFAYCTVLDQEERTKEIRQAAIRKLEQTRTSAEGETIEKQCQFWHDKYYQFRKTVFLFIKGMQLFTEEKYDRSLTYFVYSCHHSLVLADKITEMGVMSIKLIAFYRRQCMLHINDIATHHFETHDDVTDSLNLMNTYVLPCLTLLLQSDYDDDTSAAEEIREKWCAFLGQEIGDKKIEKLQDFLSKLFDQPAEIKVPQPPVVHISDLKDLYKNYLTWIDTADRSGYLERALKSK